MRNWNVCCCSITRPHLSSVYMIGGSPRNDLSNTTHECKLWWWNPRVVVRPGLFSFHSFIIHFDLHPTHAWNEKRRKLVFRVRGAQPATSHESNRIENGNFTSFDPFFRAPCAVREREFFLFLSLSIIWLLCVSFCLLMCVHECFVCRAGGNIQRGRMSARPEFWLPGWLGVFALLFPPSFLYIVRRPTGRWRGRWRVQYKQQQCQEYTCTTNIRQKEGSGEEIKGPSSNSNPKIDTICVMVSSTFGVFFRCVLSVSHFSHSPTVAVRRPPVRILSSSAFGYYVPHSRGVAVKHATLSDWR